MYLTTVLLRGTYEITCPCARKDLLEEKPYNLLLEKLGTVKFVNLKGKRN